MKLTLNDVSVSEVPFRSFHASQAAQSLPTSSTLSINFADLQPATPLNSYGTPPTILFATITLNTLAIPTMRAACLPSARVSIIVDNAALTEHSTEGDDGLGATTFVEAVPGTAFAVEMELDHRFPHRKRRDKLIFTIYLDGEYASSTFVHGDNGTYGPIKSVVSGAIEQKGGESWRRAFRFAQHATSMLVSAYNGVPMLMSNYSRRPG